ncbi:ABC transporter substrate-binding protein [Methylopila sp. Yamaguchi]|uniref:ABC transporter substrate-binding protein n=1 Tax=Methylopila sp. Yamaguchi TaxID=1437817 RepID=UPI000CC19210|nr:ABC transporter substrate-binding protein [Methylopila sp. Yamaguchi]GBD46844.1 sulfate ester transporter substrate-binding protein [Methylopila sp. Yamaguchi]
MSAALTRRALLTVGAAAGALALAPRPARADALTVRIGYAAIGADNAPFANGTIAATAHAANALEKAFADQPDVKIEWFFFRGAGPAVNEALANGQLDLAYQGDLPAIAARANGLKTRLLLAAGARTPLYLAVQPDSAIATVKDLRGKKVALFRGTSGHLAAVKVLTANGLTERDLQIVNLDYAAAVAAIANKDIDAIFGQLNLIGLKDKSVAKIVYTTKGDRPEFGRNGHVLATEAFERSRPEIVQKVVTTLVRTAHWSSLPENRAALIDLWAKSGVEKGILAQDLEGDDLAVRSSPVIDDFIRAQYAAQARAARENGLVRRDVDTDGWFETRYLDAALKELKLESFWPRFRADGTKVNA